MKVHFFSVVKWLVAAEEYILTAPLGERCLVLYSLTSTFSSLSKKDSTTRHWNKQCAPVLQDTNRTCVLISLSQLQLCVPIFFLSVLYMQIQPTLILISFVLYSVDGKFVCVILFCPFCLFTCSIEVLRVLKSSNSMKYLNHMRPSRSSLTSLHHTQSA